MRTVPRAELRTAQTPVASTVPEPHGKPGGGLWGHPGLMAPPYIEHVAGEMMKQGHSESDSYHLAVGIVENWAAGHDGHGNKVHPDVQAAAAKNIAEWEALRAKYAGGSDKRFNPYHLPVGPGGGEFTGPSGGGGGSKTGSSAKGKTTARPSPMRRKTVAKTPSKTHAKPRKPSEHARKEQLLAQARADKAEAHRLQVQLHALEQQLHASIATSKKAASAHKAAAAGKKVTGKTASKATKGATKTSAAHTAAKTTAALQMRITAVRTQIRDLLAQAAQLEAQAHAIRSMPEGSAGMALEVRAPISAADQNDLADSAFAYVEPGGTKDGSGKTVPRSLRHFPIHDAAHVRNALSRAPQSPFGDKAMPKIKAAAAKFGVQVGDDSDSSDDGGRSLLADEEIRELRINSCYRDLDLSLETRSSGDGTWIGGYASVFQPRESRNLGGFIERVASHAFNDAKMDGWPDVVCRFNHNSDLVLGTVAAGTLQLRTDPTGLDYQVLPPESRADVRELVERGDIRYSSFAFRVPSGGDEWGVTDQNFPVRTLHTVELVDVSPVLTPAYPNATAAVRATTPALRSLADHMQITVDEVRSLADADELRRLFVRTDKPIYRPEPKRLFGAQAAALLLARREDPYVNEG